MHQAKSGRCRFWLIFWEEPHGLAERGILWWKWNMLAHRTKKEKKEKSHFEKFITEGNEKADELAKGGALLDKEFLKEARAETMQQEREKVYAAMQCAASFHC